MRGSQATENRAVAGGKDGSHEGGLDAGRPMPHPIDAGVHAEQATRPDPAGDLLAAHPCSEQPRAGNNSVRGAGDSGKFLVGSPARGPHLGP